MRVAVVTYQYPPTPGGISGYSAELVKYLRLAGHEVTVFCNTDQYGDVKLFDDFLKRKSTRRNVFRVRKWAKENEGSFDVVHSTELSAAYCGFVLARVCKCKHVVTVHGNDFLQTRNSFIKRKVSDFVLKNAEIIAVSFNSAMILQKHGFVDVNVISPGLDIQKLKGPFLKIKGAKKDTIVSVCRLTELKGVDSVIEALDYLPGYRLIVVGDGPDMGRLKRLASGKDVVFVGYVDPRPYYEIAKCLVVPSRFALVKGKTEAFGKVYVEAAFFGCPSIALKCGGIPDAIKEDVSGFLISPYHDIIHDLVESIKCVDKKVMSAGCKAWAACFDWEKVVEEVVACYQ